MNTTAYHRQTDGLVEKFNHTLCQSMSIYVSCDQKDWDTHIPAILFGYRVRRHETTGDSPFYLLYGREPRLPLDASLIPPSSLSTSVNEHRARTVQTTEEVHAIARENIERTHQTMKNSYDRESREPNSMLGDRVWYTRQRQRKVSHAS